MIVIHGLSSSDQLGIDVQNSKSCNYCHFPVSFSRNHAESSWRCCAVAVHSPRSAARSSLLADQRWPNTTASSFQHGFQLVLGFLASFADSSWSSFLSREQSVKFRSVRGSYSLSQ